MKFLHIKKGDLLLFAVLLLLALVGGLTLLLTQEEGAVVVITVNQEELARLSLDTDEEYLVETELGSNLVVIRDGMAYVTEADCPDQICVRNYASGICYNGETIICLPHKLVVSIEGGEVKEDGVDAIVS